MFSVAAELLEALDAAPEVAQRQFRDRLAQLVTLFPGTTEAYLEDILSRVDGDLERAVTVMTAPNSPYHRKVPAPPAPLERPLAPDFSYHGSPWLADAAPAAPQPGLRAQALTVVIPAPVAPQLSPRARALAKVIATPTQPDREDTPMEEATAAPDLLAPPPERPEPESEPESPLTPWHPTQDDVLAQQDAAYLRRMFPTISDEFVTQAIKEGDGDPAAAIAWAAAITDADRVLGVLATAFPAATSEEVKNATLHANGSATAAYALLFRRHESAWDPEQFRLTSQVAQRLLPADPELAPEFYDPDPTYAEHEAKWWDTMVATKAYKVADLAEDSALWSHITLLAGSRADVGPRSASHVESLATARYLDRPAFNRSMGVLQTHSSYAALAHHCQTNPKQTDSTLRIVMALMEDGLASPGAAAWAMSLLTRTPAAFRAGRFCFSAYGANRRTLWNQRNQALAAWRHARNPPLSDAQYSQNLDQGASIGPMPSPAPSQRAPPGAPNPRSNITTPTSARPRSLPGAASWALPLSESTSKYVGVTARPRAKQTRSASASGVGEPLEGQSDPGLVVTKLPAPRPTSRGTKTEALAALRKKEKEEKRGEN